MKIVFSVCLPVIRQLPTEYKLFMSVDKAWKDIMRRTEDRPNALKSAITPGTLDTLQMCNSNLERVQKCLEVSVYNGRYIHCQLYYFHHLTSNNLWCSPHTDLLQTLYQVMIIIIIIIFPHGNRHCFCNVMF